MRTIPLRKFAGLLLKIAVTCALFAWLFRSIDPVALQRSLSALSPGAIGLAFVLVVAQTLILGWRWHRIIRRLEGTLPPSLAIRWTFVGLFFNQALPSSVGGDAVRIWLLHRHGARKGLPFASVAIERLTGVTLLGLMISASVIWMNPALTDPAIAGALLLAGPVLLLLLAALTMLGKPLARSLPGPVGSALGSVGEGLRGIARSSVALLEIVGLGAAANLIGLVAAAVLGRALGIELDTVSFVALVGGAVLLSILPVSLGGWGLREAGMVTLFASVGVPAEPVLAMSLVWGLLPLVVSIPAGLLWWVSRHSGAAKPSPGRADGTEA